MADPKPVMHSVQGLPGHFIFWCAGCECAHGINSGWIFDGDLVKPTISPSILSQGLIRCHSFVRAGRIEYLADSEHPLAGTTVALEPFPDGLTVSEGDGAAGG
jgi:hypothetical protein